MTDNESEWQKALSAIDLSAIESLKVLKLEHDELDGRLKAMDEHKKEVADAVYQRVRDDYQKRLRGLDDKAAPLKQAAREQYTQLRAQLERFEADHDSVKLDQQELELRHKLGEFDEKEYQRRNKAIETAVKDKAEARARALELKSRFLEAFHAESELEAAPADSGTPADTSSTGPMTAVHKPPPEVAAADVSAGNTQIMSPVVAGDAKPAARPAAAANSGATQIFRAARLVPQNPEAGKQTYALTLKPMSIGADSSNDIRVGGPGVDAKHAQIMVSMGGFSIADLGSKHGTRVNAEKIRERTLANEDVIQIGAARFVFREG